MIISITIDDSAATLVMQDIALARGWTKLTDDEVRVRLADELRDTVLNLALAGDSIKVRNEQQAEIRAQFNKVIAT